MNKVNKTKITFKNVLIAVGAISILVLTASNAPQVVASRAEQLRSEINQLENEIDANRAQLAHLDHEADTLAAAIADFDKNIEATNQEIQLIQLKLDEIKHQLELTRAELERQKKILSESLREHYTYGDVRTIELLVDSESFSDFFDQQEYLDRIRSSIQNSAKLVAELEAQLVAQETEQKRLMEEQQAKKAELEAKRAGKQKLLDETRGEEALYQARLDSLESQRNAADAELDRYIQSLLDSGVSLGPIGEGEFIGGVGNTGYSSGPHLHFAIQKSGNAYNPMTVMEQKGWTWPVPSHTRTSQGYHSGHRALDIPAPIGTPIVSTGNGEIIHKGCLGEGRFRNYAVLVSHGNGWVSRYIHMNPPQGNSAYDSCRANTYY